MRMSPIVVAPMPTYTVEAAGKRLVSVKPTWGGVGWGGGGVVEGGGLG